MVVYLADSSIGTWAGNQSPLDIAQKLAQRLERGVASSFRRR